jgi:hypothetical protein
MTERPPYPWELGTDDEDADDTARGPAASSPVVQRHFSPLAQRFGDGARQRCVAAGPGGGRILTRKRAVCSVALHAAVGNVQFPAVRSILWYALPQRQQPQRLRGRTGTACHRASAPRSPAWGW